MLNSYMLVTGRLVLALQNSIWVQKMTTCLSSNNDVGNSFDYLTPNTWKVLPRRVQCLPPNAYTTISGGNVLQNHPDFSAIFFLLDFICHSLPLIIHLQCQVSCILSFCAAFTLMHLVALIITGWQHGQDSWQSHVCSKDRARKGIH